MAEPGKSPRFKTPDPAGSRVLSGAPTAPSPTQAPASVRSDASRRAEKDELAAQFRQEPEGEDSAWFGEFASMLSLTPDGGAQFLKLVQHLSNVEQPSVEEALAGMLCKNATEGQQNTLRAYLQTISPQDFKLAHRSIKSQCAGIDPALMKVADDVKAERSGKTSRQQIREAEADTIAVLQEIRRKDPVLAAGLDVRLDNAPDEVLKKKRAEKKD